MLPLLRAGPLLLSVSTLLPFFLDRASPRDRFSCSTSEDRATLHNVAKQLNWVCSIFHCSVISPVGSPKYPSSRGSQLTNYSKAFSVVIPALSFKVTICSLERLPVSERVALTLINPKLYDLRKYYKNKWILGRGKVFWVLGDFLMFY